MNILLVEDHPGDARIIQDSLPAAGALQWNLVHVIRLKDAIASAAANSYDVVLLDLHLPDSQGLQTFLAFSQAAPDLPVVILTGMRDEQVGVKAMRLGAQDYLFKGAVDEHLLGRSLRYARERFMLLRQLRAMSLCDDLTGLHNRRGFASLAGQQMRIADREGRRLLLFFIDLDGMKTINDQFGHLAGDLALVRAGSLLQEVFRRSDLVCRLGGDEFAALTTEDRPETQETLLTRIRSRVAEVNASGDLPFPFMLSVGVSVYEPGTEMDLDELVGSADKAMYEEKKERRSAPRLNYADLRRWANTPEGELPASDSSAAEP